MPLESQIILSITLYKLSSLFIGLVSLLLGYKLFKLGINKPAGDVNVSSGNVKFSITGAPSGTFFAILGTVIIFFTLEHGLEINTAPEISADFRQEQHAELQQMPEKPEK